MKWVNMMMPEGVGSNKATQTATFAELEIAPLERGFGHTLGNALRRTLLSSHSRARRSRRCRSTASSTS